MSTSNTRVEINEAFFVALGRSPMVVDLCQRQAKRIEDRARALASQHVKSGDYLRGFDTVRADRDGRACFLVRNTDRKSILLEMRMGILARALKG